MALIICPECGKEISDSAKMCPGCGYSIKSKNGMSSKINKRKMAIIAIIMVIAVIVLVSVILVPDKLRSVKWRNIENDLLAGHKWKETESEYNAIGEPKSLFKTSIKKVYPIFNDEGELYRIIYFIDAKENDYNRIKSKIESSNDITDEFETKKSSQYTWEYGDLEITISNNIWGMNNYAVTVETHD